MKKLYLILNINTPILVTNDFLKAYEYCTNANKGDYDYFQKTIGECINDLQLYNDCSIGKLRIMTVEKALIMWKRIVEINTIMLVLAAICCGAGHWAGAFLFVYTSTIGFIDSVKNNNYHGIVINASFLALNLFNSVKFIISFVKKVKSKTF